MAPHHPLERELVSLLAHSPSALAFLERQVLDGTWFWNLERPDEEYLSPRFWEVLGFDPAEQPHAPAAWQALVHPTDLVEAHAAISRHVAEPQVPFDQVLRFRHADGHTVWIRCRGIALRDADGTPTRMLGVHVDVSAQHAVAEAMRAARADAEAASAAKSAFLAHLSHEIRTPLAGVSGILALLEREFAAPEPRAWLHTARDSTERLMTLLTDMLDLARAEAQQLTVDDEPFDLHALLRASAALFAPLIQQRGGRMHTHLDGDVPVWVRGDALRLQQVLHNLLGNAVKHAPGSSVRLLARVVADAGGSGDLAKAGRRLHLAVEDDGPGLDPGEVARVFEPYRQGRGHGRGTGLGLPIARRIAEALGGRLDAHAVSGGGAGFHVTLPLRPADAHAASPTATEGDAWPLHVVVGEDDALQREVLVRMLQRGGHRVTAFAAEGPLLAAWPHLEADVLVLDLELGDASAVEVIEGLDALDAAETPVVVVTAHAPADARVLLGGAPVSACLAKPVTAEALEDALHAARAGTPPRAAARG